MMGAWRVTPAELGRRLDGIEARMQHSLKSIDDRLATTLIGRGEYEAKHEALQVRVVEVERTHRAMVARVWALAIAVVAALVSGGIGLAVAVVR